MCYCLEGAGDCVCVYINRRWTFTCRDSRARPYCTATIYYVLYTALIEICRRVKSDCARTRGCRYVPNSFSVVARRRLLFSSFLAAHLLLHMRDSTRSHATILSNLRSCFCAILHYYTYISGIIAIRAAGCGLRRAA